MKKKILLALVTLVLLLSVVLSGCAASGVPQADYDKLSAQITDVQSKLTKAQTDLTTLQSAKTTVDSDLKTAQTKVTDLEKQVTDLKAQYELTGATKAETAKKIVKYYGTTHVYEKDVYDCNNMASDVWNMLKAQGISAVIVVGSIESPITNILDSNHAWVLVEVSPGQYLALDATNGHSVTRTENSYYYRGWSFATPAGLKRNDDLKTEYNARVIFVNTLVSEVNNAMALYNNSADQTEADKWLALYNKLVELKNAQQTLLTNLEAQINQLATQIQY
jgi:outer membrane murein-binding lipoprotein Lpp